MQCRNKIDFESIGKKAAIHCWRLVLTLAVTVLLASTSIQAQQYLGTLSGSVADPSGAKIVGATVVAKDTTTNFETKVVTGGSGDYNIPFLTPDTYSITVSSQGFGTQTHTGVILTAGASVHNDFSLKTASADTQVTVTADTQLLNTASANLETTLSTTEVTDLPNVGRNPYVLATLAAGVYNGASGGYFQGKSSTYTNPYSGVAVQIVTNGSSGHNRLTLDGIPDDPAERFSGASYTGFVPSPEAVQEVNVQTGLYDAAYGHGNGVVTNTVLRAGSDKFHGSAYNVFRNTYLNANTFERVPTQSTTTPRSNDQWEQPGGVFSGPLLLPHHHGANKTFFMVAFERIQLHQTLPYSSLVPTTTGTIPAGAPGAGGTDGGQAAGDFSSLCSSFNAQGVCNPGAGQQIYDPLSVVSGNGDRTPFAWNIIPSARFSGTAGAALMSYLPKPNSTYSPTVNYISNNTSAPNRYYSVVTRVDHSFSDAHKINGTYFKDVLHQFYPVEGFPKGIGPTTNGTGSSGDGYIVTRNNEGGSVDDVLTITPTLVVDSRFGLIYHPFGLVYPGSTFNLSSLGISGSGLPYQSFPGTNLSDSYAGLSAGSLGQVSEDTLGSASVLVAKTLQKHSLRFGFDGNLIRYNVQNPQSGFAVFNFNKQFTQKNSSGQSGANCDVNGGAGCVIGADPNSGNALASMLLGNFINGTTANYGYYQNTIAFALQQQYIAFYAQDDWRVSSKLTVNGGLRWDYESPFTDRYNRLNSGFCTTCANPLQGSVNGLNLNGGLTFANSAATPSRYAVPQKFTNFQPRFGAAYQITPKIVARSGVGLIYYNTRETPLAQGYSNQTLFVATTNSVYPTTNLSNPFPAGVNLPTGNSLGLSTQLGQSISFPDPNHVQPHMLQWSTSVQIQLPSNLVLQLAYAGNRASNLEINKSIDALPASYMGTTGAPLNTTQIAALNASATNPMASVASQVGTSLGAANIKQYLLDIPYPEFSNVTDNYRSEGSALYNALEITVKKQLSHGFEAQGNVTWSKEMDRTIYLNPQDTTPFRFQDSNPNLVVNIFGTYHFSELKSKPVYERLTLGGWKLQAILRAADGVLVPGPGGTGPGSQFGLTQTYKQIGPVAQPKKSYARTINTCYENSAGALVYTTATASGTVPGCDSNSPTPAFQLMPSFTLASVGPYLSVREIVHPQVDASLFKTFPIHGDVNFEIRGEFFNAFNSPNFGAPGTTPGTATYGFVTMTQANDPRLTQLTARINF